MSRPRGFKKSKQIPLFSDLDPLSLERGANNEARVAKILNFFKDYGIIEDFYGSRPNDVHDANGIDFMVKHKGSSLPLSVKSSFRGRREHIERYGYSIPCVVANDRINDETLMQALFKILHLDM